MNIGRLPKQVLDLFPRWSYQCPECGKEYDDAVQACVQCGTSYEESKWRIPPKFLKNYEAMSEYAHRVLAPKLSPSQRALLFQYFTRLLSSGWEDSGGSDITDGGKWTATGSPSVVESPVHCGNYAAEFNAHYEYVSKEFSQKEQAYARMYCRITDPPENNTHRVILMWLGTPNGDGNWSQVDIYNKNGTNIWRFIVDTTTGQEPPIEVSGVSVTADIWYCIEVWRKADTVAGSMLWINGTLKAKCEGTVSDDNITQVLVGSIELSNGYSNTTYIDCVVVDDDTYIGPGEPAELGVANFETGNLSEFDGTPYENGTVTVTTDVAYNGQYSCKCDVNENGTAWAEGFFDIGAHEPVYCRGYFRFNRLPGSNPYREYTIIWFEKTGSSTVGRIQLVYNNGHKWKMVRSTGTAEESYSSSHIPSVDTWVCVEFAHGEGLAKLWVDGYELLTHTDATNQTVDRVHVGACNSAMDADNDLEIYVDNVVVSNVSIAPLNEYTEAKQLRIYESAHILHNTPQIDVKDYEYTTAVIPTYYTTGNGNIMFEDTTPPDEHHAYPDGQKTSLYQVMVELPPDPSTGERSGIYAPFIATDHGFWVEKDIMTYGGLFTDSDPLKGSGGGAIMMGHGFLGNDTPPCISLVDENYGELYLYKREGSSISLGDMKLGNLTATQVNATQVRLGLSYPVLSEYSGYLKIDSAGGGHVRISTGAYTYFISTAPYMFNNDITINGNLNCTGDIDCNNLNCAGDITFSGINCSALNCTGDIDCNNLNCAGDITFSGINCSGDVIPTDEDEYKCGTETKYWAEVNTNVMNCLELNCASGATIGDYLSVAAAIGLGAGYPVLSSENNLLKISNGSGYVRIGRGGTDVTFQSTVPFDFNNQIVSGGNVTPKYENSYSCGTASKYWANLYSALATIGNCTITSQAIFTYFQDQIRFQISGEDVIFHMCRPDINRIWGVYNYTDSMWKAYLQDSNSSMYVNGSYYTFSPKVSNERSELIKQLKHETEKPYIDHDDKGRIVCHYCKKVDCEDPEHMKLQEETFAKDIGLVSLASGKLVAMLCDEIDALKSRLAKLEAQKDVA